MAEYTKQIHYRLNGATNDIKLYTTVEEVGANYVSLMDGGATVYAGLIEPTDSLASNVRVRRNGNIFALARECTTVDPNPGLLLQRTRAGTHTTHYSVGDTFDIKLNGAITDHRTFNNETYRAVIIGFDHNKDLETDGAHSTHLALALTTDNTPIAFVGVPDTIVGQAGTAEGLLTRHIKETDTYSVGWENSLIRQYNMPNFYSVLPPEWQAVIGNVTKYTDNVGNKSTSEAAVTATTEKMFLLSEYELTGTTTKANIYEANKQEQYEWFIQGNTQSSRIRFRHYMTTMATGWWLRSADRTNVAAYACIRSSGQLGGSGGKYNYALLPCFAVF